MKRVQRSREPSLQSTEGATTAMEGLCCTPRHYTQIGDLIPSCPSCQRIPYTKHECSAISIVEWDIFQLQKFSPLSPLTEISQYLLKHHVYITVQSDECITEHWMPKWLNLKLICIISLAFPCLQYQFWTSYLWFPSPTQLSPKLIFRSHLSSSLIFWFKSAFSLKFTPPLMSILTDLSFSFPTLVCVCPSLPPC